LLIAYYSTNVAGEISTDGVIVPLIQIRLKNAPFEADGRIFFK
jgi:hypothetical protein